MTYSKYLRWLWHFDSMGTMVSLSFLMFLSVLHLDIGCQRFTNGNIDFHKQNCT